MKSERVLELITTLGLSPHPEGGYYRELWRGGLGVTPSDGRGQRSALTLIYFLLPTGAVSRWHRVRSDEVWHWCEGAPLELLQLSEDGTRVERHELGPMSENQAPVHCVPAGRWQAARSLGAYTLVSCSVGPGFDFADFELVPRDAGWVSELVQRAPEAAAFV